jgi:acyl dehydratase
VTVTFDNPAALLESVGTDLGQTDWLTIDQGRIDAFAGATGDFQWIHTDPARAAAGPYGATIAHGYLTLSLVASFLEELLAVAGTTTVINAGSDRVRFIQPVLVGSRLRASAVVIAANPAAGGVRVATRVTVEIDGQERPALVADVLTVFLGS